MNVAGSVVDVLESASDRFGRLDGRFLVAALVLQLGTLAFRSLAWRGVLVAAYPGRQVRVVSVAGAYAAGVAMNAFIKTATEIAKDGKFDGFGGLISNAELNTFFSEDRKKRS